MAQSRRTTFRPRGRSARPGGGWARIRTSATNAGGGVKTLVSSLALSNPDIDETLRRVIGELWHFSDQAAATETYTGAFGIIVVNDVALAAGAASIPGPITDQNDNGWLFWAALMGGFQFGTGVGFESAPGVHMQIESRAMRRVREGFGLALMMESSGGSAGFSLQLGLSFYATRTAT